MIGGLTISTKNRSAVFKHIGNLDVDFIIDNLTYLFYRLQS